MSITNEEKEQLFEEFEQRLGLKKKKQGYATCKETITNLKPAHDYFWNMYYKMRSEFPFELTCYHGMQGSDWDLIRKLTCRAYGYSIVKDIPPEVLDEANSLAITIIDLLYDRNYKHLKQELKKEELT